MPRRPPTRCNRCRRLYPSGTRCPCKVWSGSRWADTLPVPKSVWERTRRAYLNEYPLCEYPLCKAIADDVDHIVELSDGGDPLDWANLQALCVVHHAAKTAAHAVASRARART